MEITNTITEALRELRIPMGNLGFNYISKAVSIVLEDESRINNLTRPGGIYEEVARHFNTLPSRAERAIRHSIEIAFKSADKAVLMRYFGHSEGCETNKNFIANMVYAVKKETEA
jgi:two-component system response regulator (stage 0 sporulation protein A)